MAKAFTLVGGLGGGTEWTGSYTITPTTSNIVIPEETVFVRTLTIKGAPELSAENIKANVSLFGITGQAYEVQMVGGEGVAYLASDYYRKPYKITNIKSK